MRKSKFKKATLSISIGAIVVIVIAFVVLGLGLTLTKTIFGGASEKIPGILDIGEIGKEPTSENPLTIDDNIIIKRLSDKELKVGFYNRGIDTAEQVEIALGSCVSVDPNINVTGKEPTVTSIKQDVEGSEGVGYQIFIRENGLNAGNYLCAAAAEGMLGDQPEVFETKQVTLKVTT
jgi:hypothetical protein